MSEASRVGDDTAHAFKLEADFGQKGVKETNVDPALTDKNDNQGAEVGIEQGAAAWSMR